MGKMFVIVMKHPGPVRKILTEDRINLKIPKEERSDGWGIGYYCKDEPLLKKKPIEEREFINLLGIIGDIETGIMMGHVREATYGVVSEANTHPFRFTNWLFMHTGSINGFEKIKTQIKEMIPPFLIRNIKGETDSEHIFFLFLSFLYDTGKLSKQYIKAEELLDTSEKTLKVLNQFVIKAGFENIGDNSFVITNGKFVIVVRHGVSPLYKTVVEKIKMGLPVDNTAIMVVSPKLKVGGMWEELPNNSALIISDDLKTVQLHHLEL